MNSREGVIAMFSKFVFLNSLTVAAAFTFVDVAHIRDLPRQRTTLPSLLLRPIGSDSDQVKAELSFSAHAQRLDRELSRPSPRLDADDTDIRSAPNARKRWLRVGRAFRPLRQYLAWARRDLGPEQAGEVVNGMLKRWRRSRRIARGLCKQTETSISDMVHSTTSLAALCSMETAATGLERLVGVLLGYLSARIPMFWFAVEQGYSRRPVLEIGREMRREVEKRRKLGRELDAGESVELVGEDLRDLDDSAGDSDLLNTRYRSQRLAEANTDRFSAAWRMLATLKEALGGSRSAVKLVVKPDGEPFTDPNEIAGLVERAMDPEAAAESEFGDWLFTEDAMSALFALMGTSRNLFSMAPAGTAPTFALAMLREIEKNMGNEQSAFRFQDALASLNFTELVSGEFNLNAINAGSVQENSGAVQKFSEDNFQQNFAKFVGPETDSETITKLSRFGEQYYEGYTRHFYPLYDVVVGQAAWEMRLAHSTMGVGDPVPSVSVPKQSTTPPPKPLSVLFSHLSAYVTFLNQLLQHGSHPRTNNIPNHENYLYYGHLIRALRDIVGTTEVWRSRVAGTGASQRQSLDLSSVDEKSYPDLLDDLQRDRVHMLTDELADRIGQTDATPTLANEPDNRNPFRGNFFRARPTQRDLALVPYSPLDIHQYHIMSRIPEVNVVKAPWLPAVANLLHEMASWRMDDTLTIFRGQAYRQPDYFEAVYFHVQAVSPLNQYNFVGWLATQLAHCIYAQAAYGLFVDSLSFLETAGLVARSALSPYTGQASEDLFFGDARDLSYAWARSVKNLREMSCTVGAWMQRVVERVMKRARVSEGEWAETKDVLLNIFSADSLQEGLRNRTDRGRYFTLEDMELHEDRHAQGLIGQDVPGIFVSSQQYLGVKPPTAAELADAVKRGVSVENDFSTSKPEDATPHPVSWKLRNSEGGNVLIHSLAALLEIDVQLASEIVQEIFLWRDNEEQFIKFNVWSEAVDGDAGAVSDELYIFPCVFPIEKWKVMDGFSPVVTPMDMSRVAAAAATENDARKVPTLEELFEAGVQLETLDDVTTALAAPAETDSKSDSLLHILTGGDLSSTTVDSNLSEQQVPSHLSDSYLAKTSVPGTFLAPGCTGHGIVWSPSADTHLMLSGDSVFGGVHGYAVPADLFTSTEHGVDAQADAEVFEKFIESPLDSDAGTNGRNELRLGLVLRTSGGSALQNTNPWHDLLDWQLPLLTTLYKWVHHPEKFLPRSLLPHWAFNNVKPMNLHITLALMGNYSIDHVHDFGHPRAVYDPREEGETQIRYRRDAQTRFEVERRISARHNRIQERNWLSDKPAGRFWVIQEMVAGILEEREFQAQDGDSVVQDVSLSYSVLESGDTIQCHDLLLYAPGGETDTNVFAKRRRPRWTDFGRETDSLTAWSDLQLSPLGVGSKNGATDLRHIWWRRILLPFLDRHGYPQNTLNHRAQLSYSSSESTAEKPIVMFLLRRSPGVRLLRNVPGLKLELERDESLSSFFNFHYRFINNKAIAESFAWCAKAHVIIGAHGAALAACTAAMRPGSALVELAPTATFLSTEGMEEWMEANPSELQSELQAGRINTSESDLHSYPSDKFAYATSFPRYVTAQYDPQRPDWFFNHHYYCGGGWGPRASKTNATGYYPDQNARSFYTGIARLHGSQNGPVRVMCVPTLPVLSPVGKQLYPGIVPQQTYAWRARDLVLDVKVLKEMLEEVRRNLEQTGWG